MAKNSILDNIDRINAYLIDFIRYSKSSLPKEAINSFIEITFIDKNLEALLVRVDFITISVNSVGWGSSGVFMEAKKDLVGIREVLINIKEVEKLKDSARYIAYLLANGLQDSPMARRLYA